MPANKKFEEQLQDIRHKQHDKIAYLKRKQEEELADEYLQEELDKLKRDENNN
jgi:hypothetical protein